MRNRKQFLYNGVFALNCLLVFLLLMESRLHLPAWLQVAGRLHPLVLHFPLVLVILTVTWEGLRALGFLPSDLAEKTGDTLLLATAGTAAAAAICGMLLSREPGYDAGQLLWHKWTGILVSLGCCAWYAGRRGIRKRRWILGAGSFVMLLLLLVTGHEGAGITHGEDFLTAPLASREEKKIIALEDAKVFDDVILPILDTKCNSCHNSRKAKGELVMTDKIGFLKGGKNGILWDSTAKDFGLLLRRIHLPLDDKKRMPPKGKPELTPEEAAILFYWIRSGANTAVKLTDLPKDDSLRVLTESNFKTSGTEYYTFEPASSGTVEKLNNHYRLVAPISTGSPALTANLFGAKAYSGKSLEELLPVKNQLVSLGLDKMPVTDKDLEVVAQFSNLRELRLSFTDITDAGVSRLAKLPFLREVSVTGTKVSATGLKAIAGIPSVRTVYCWSMGAKDADIRQLAKAYPGIQWESGFFSDTVKIKLNPPVIENDKVIFADLDSISMRHFFPGTILRYTLDGSVPDSITSPVYQHPVVIRTSTPVRVRAFREGWVGSETITRFFYLKGKMPDSTWFRFAPDSGYQGKGTATLFDGEKGGMIYREKQYLGFRNHPLELYMRFNKPVSLNRLELSALVDVPSYIFPATGIELSGRKGSQPYQLLYQTSPRQPQQDSAAYQTIFSCTFPEREVTELRLHVQSTQKLPKWHRGKNEKGWVFVDEIFLQ
ncbi:FN3 associated domain-containing protein [Flavihumibacter petaseus]|uniref:Uncharacterized protein n=1 Tax=Flavihumibacter petaseus NBRC 106054 TaxID=1220578 RepID=A0A0E9N195_9BACT|nr:FN3 associated domain-containing protein [Flavihumibacter petaseus]GAO43406.1 hypothetical protein FPE01S_02_05110 [Flavihumibacter petaseus NBRC 106054]